jgi:hypothetical protein
MSSEFQLDDIYLIFDISMDDWMNFCGWIWGKKFMDENLNFCGNKVHSYEIMVVRRDIPFV